MVMNKIMDFNDKQQIGEACRTNEGEEVIGGKARRKETKMQVGG
jgi:hypothetical protein